MFQESSRRISLQDDHILRADCRKSNGEYKPSELDLDFILGNNKGKFFIIFPLPVIVINRNIIAGKFIWNGKNWRADAENINLKFEGPKSTDPILHADLKDPSGNRQQASLHLGTCIRNEDGELTFMHCFY